MRSVRFAADERFELSRLGGDPSAPRAFLRTYYDTSDHALARAGISLSRGTEGGRSIWRLALAGAAGARLEARGGRDAAPEALARLLPALTRRRPLEQAAVLRTRRELVHVRLEGGAVAEVVLDSVAVIEGRRVVRTFEELEARLLAGRKRDLKNVETSLRSAGARDPDTRTTLARALELPAPTPRRPESAPEVLQAMISRQLVRMLEHDPGARLGDDPEDVHQLRVATRRLRAFLRAARPLIEGTWGDELRAELGWVGGMLGPVRDLDVLTGRLSEEAESLEETERDALAPLFAALAEGRELARRALLEALESDRYLELLDRLEQAGEAPALARGGTTLRSIWRSEFRRLRRRVDRLPPDPGDEELHAVRIAAKRARYAAELAEPELAGRGRRFVARARQLQDVLGEHQDAAVAEERVRAAAATIPEPLGQLAAGRLVERQRRARRRARGGFGKAWRKLDRAGRKAER